MSDHYVRPGWFTNHVFNRMVRGLTRIGISIKGSRVLEVKGRKSGEPRSTAVNLLTLGDTQYLVAPRGVTDWVRNVRAANGSLAVHLGRRRTELIGREMADADKVTVLREYLRRWEFEVKMFFDGVTAKSTDEEIGAIASKHPIFVLSPAAKPGQPGT